MKTTCKLQLEGIDESIEGKERRKDTYEPPNAILDPSIGRLLQPEFDPALLIDLRMEYRCRKKSVDTFNVLGLRVEIGFCEEGECNYASMACCGESKTTKTLQLCSTLLAVFLQLDCLVTYENIYCKNLVFRYPINSLSI